MSANTGTCSTSATICLIIDIYHCINRIFLITIIKTIVDKNTTNGAVNEYIFTIGEFYQFNLSSCIRQQNSLTAQFVSF
ncbi:hypothetical protein PO257_20630, partial [Bacteroides ovatus]|nr:hypothetical protein [Bacteroides ovatus]